MLEYYIKFYVPSTQDVSGVISSDKLNERVDTIAFDFALTFGGATVEDTVGYYKADSGELVKEQVKRVVAFSDFETLQANFERIKKLAENAKKAWGQESIAIETVTGLQFI